MTLDVTETARTLAGHALPVLAVGIAILVAGLVGALAVARRYRGKLAPVLHVALGFIAIAAIGAFLLIAWQVSGGSSLAAFDVAFARALHDTVTPGWSRFFRNVTLLGIGWVLGLAAGVVGLGLLIRRKFIFAVGWIVAQGGAVLLVRGVKHIVERTRPGLAESQFLATGWSFPSGHVTRTLVFCGMAVYLIYRLSGSWTVTWIAAALAVIWSLLMAFSRLYLGAHFPSDVVAGIVVGTAWMAVCISGIEEALRRARRPSIQTPSGER